MRVLIPRLAALSLALSAFPARALSPANPNSTAKARAILEYFAGLPDRSDHRVVSGQFTNFGDRSNLNILEDTKRVGGHYPGMMGGDYADFEENSVTYAAVNKAAIAYWNAGGLVTLCAHVPHPGGGDLKDRDVDLARMMTPGTDLNRNWMRTLDSMAVGLRALRDAGVVVLWRPFHEMNGDWFWWNGKDTAAFNKAWRHMFDYYSKDKGLDNLLWVYGPNMGGKVTNYYPGPAYVDMVGLDAYTDYIDSNTIKGYSQLVRLGKPFGFSEYGPHGPDNPPGNFDYRKLIAGIRRDFPRTTYFLCWNSRWSLSRNLFTRELLDDPWIANREDLEFTTGVRIARSASSLGRGLRAGRTFLCLGGAVDGGCSIAIGVPTGQSAITALPGPAAGPSSLDVTGRWMPPSDRYRLLPDR